jgi:EamA domain-containing membrane protein RarD
MLCLLLLLACAGITVSSANCFAAASRMQPWQLIALWSYIHVIGIRHVDLWL